MCLELLIRSEQKTDYKAIKHVNDLAFDRFEEGNLVENLRQLPEFDERLSIIAEIDGKIVGHALFFPIHIKCNDGRDYPCLSLGPIAVTPKYQNQGIGGELINAGHSTALKLNYRAVVLLGHPGYYPRFGYKPAKQWNLSNPWGFTEEPWMAIELVENSLEGKDGLAVYPQAFNEAT